MIGSTFTKRPSAPPELPKHIRVVGQFAGGWTVQNADTFSETTLMRAEELTASYGAPLEMSREIDENALRAPSVEALREAIRNYRGGYRGSDTAPPGLSPEEQFALDGIAAAPDDG